MRGWRWPGLVLLLLLPPVASPQSSAPQSSAPQSSAPQSSAPQSSALAAPDRLSFQILREGTAVGTHDVAVLRDGDGVTVDIRIDITVRLFGALPVYRYAHRSREVWQGDRLASLETTTDDNGQGFAVSARATAEGLRLEGRPDPLDAAILPTSYWQPAMLRQSRLLNTQTGAPIAVTVAARGRESIAAAGQRVDATRYEIAGELNKEIWYDDRGIWVKSRFKAPDGSVIEYVLR